MEQGIAGSTDEALSPVTDTATVGARLRAAREAAHFSHEDVAQALKFSPRQIAALEADDYAALPGATIVRGFVRNYARLLKLDATALLRQLEAALPSGPAEVRPPDNMGVASESRGLRESSPLLTLSLVLLLAALLLALWHFFGPTSQRTGTASVESTPGATSSAMPVIQNPVVSSVAAAPAENAVMPPPPPAPEATMSTALHFSFADRSWVEVTDANKRILYSGENLAGSQLDLSGQPPFDIVIGNAGKVSLSYGGKPVDLAPYTRAEVARLTLE